MRKSLILDTHALIWFLNGDSQLSQAARIAIESISNVKYVSVASLWEMAIKINLKKLEFSNFPKLPDLISENGFELLPITFEHTLQVAALQQFHGDPFDRLLVAQGMVEQIPIISKDGNIPKYSVEVIW